VFFNKIIINKNYYYYYAVVVIVVIVDATRELAATQERPFMSEYDRNYHNWPAQQQSQQLIHELESQVSTHTFLMLWHVMLFYIKIVKLSLLLLLKFIINFVSINSSVDYFLNTTKYVN
jgi:hypothetical protein